MNESDFAGATGGAAAGTGRVPPLPTPPDRTLSTVELGSKDERRLQHFFDANPEYFLAIQGEPAAAHEAREELASEPPAGWTYTRRWLLGWAEADGTLAAMAHVVSDLLVRHVWHIGLFIVATGRHGTGDAQRLNDGLERWACAGGAHWLRLGVVRGNLRAERFWTARGYVETRTREGVQVGKQTNTVRVMVKPLAGGTVDEYLALVPRDRPETTDAT